MGELAKRRERKFHLAVLWLNLLRSCPLPGLIGQRGHMGVAPPSIGDVTGAMVTEGALTLCPLPGSLQSPGSLATTLPTGKGEWTYQQTN